MQEEEDVRWLDNKFDANFAKDPEENTPLFVEKKKPIDTSEVTGVSRTCCHSVFIAISTFSGISLVCLLVSQFAPLLFQSLRGLQLALRCYIGFFALLLILVEFDAPFAFITESEAITSWVSRGIIHSFLGLINQEESVTVVQIAVESYNITGEVDDFESAELSGAQMFQFFQSTASWMMVASGLIYVLMGLLCLDGLREKYEVQYRSDLEQEEMRRKIIAEENFKNM